MPYIYCWLCKLNHLGQAGTQVYVLFRFGTCSLTEKSGHRLLLREEQTDGVKEEIAEEDMWT
jgi:hypothetical protein